MVMANFSKTKNNSMGVPDFMEGSLILYGIGDPRVSKILEIGNPGPLTSYKNGDPGSTFGGPHFHLTQDLAN